MYIHEAAEKALKEGSYIVRRQIENGLSYFPTKIKFIRVRESCMVCVFNNKGEYETTQRRKWTPSADDLMADDWDVSN